MNLELIMQNMALCRERIQNGDMAGGREAAFMTARLLIFQAGREMDPKAMEEEELRRFMIACVGAANELHDLFTRIEPDFDLLTLPEQLKERIRNVNVDFAKKKQQLEQEEEIHRELLSREEELRETREELLNRRNKVRELAEIRERELSALQKEIRGWQEKTQQLEQACRDCREQLSLYEAELSENSALIAAMPDSTGMDGVDMLIRETREFQGKIGAERELSGQRIDAILCAIAKIYEPFPEREKP